MKQAVLRQQCMQWHRQRHRLCSLPHAQQPGIALRSVWCALQRCRYPDRVPAASELACPGRQNSRDQAPCTTLGVLLTVPNLFYLMLGFAILAIFIILWFHDCMSPKFAQVCYFLILMLKVVIFCFMAIVCFRFNTVTWSRIILFLPLYYEFTLYSWLSSGFAGCVAASSGGVLCHCCGQGRLHRRCPCCFRLYYVQPQLWGWNWGRLGWLGWNSESVWVLWDFIEMAGRLAALMFFCITFNTFDSLNECAH